ncbi:uncharacterized protein PV07_11216 [Cladophialophora immunda]|uniref:Uncharacterized protein n=1 Tax=Cladophialophora immunda TaxID=569365 RepID=A0A0D1Z5X7_9EURO|nr:uncharacterized protein PV07_11216 [Cladophialophora immunda]KIW22976.1 hypothetical protein PV07_11216 [Cladophialophora immunda]
MHCIPFCGCREVSDVRRSERQQAKEAHGTAVNYLDLVEQPAVKLQPDRFEIQGTAPFRNAAVTAFESVADCATIWRDKARTSCLRTRPSPGSKKLHLGLTPGNDLNWDADAPFWWCLTVPPSVLAYLEAPLLELLTTGVSYHSMSSEKFSVSAERFRILLLHRFFPSPPYLRSDWMQ